MDEDDIKLVRKIASLAELKTGQCPISIKHTVTDLKTGKVIRQAFYGPRTVARGRRQWIPVPPSENEIN